MKKNITKFAQEVEVLINRYSLDSESGTPDFILANYLKNCLQAYTIAITEREMWINNTEYH